MAEAPTPEFTHTFLVDSDNYGDFIRLVRQDVIKYCSQRPGVWQPVLPLEQKVPQKWFYVGLRTKTMKTPLLLAIRMDNLYLVGFQTPGGVWWEFTNDVEPGTHLITGARWLGFGGRYQDLVGQKGLETVPLGRAAMTTAVETLAKHGTRLEEEEEMAAEADPYAVPKSMLVRLVIMICEGLRFNTVYGTVDKEFDKVEARITKLDGEQVNEWYKISTAVLTWAVKPAAKFPELEKIGIKDKNDAARVVALVKDVKIAN